MNILYAHSPGVGQVLLRSRRMWTSEVFMIFTNLDTMSNLEVYRSISIRVVELQSLDERHNVYNSARRHGDMVAES